MKLNKSVCSVELLFISLPYETTCAGDASGYILIHTVCGYCRCMYTIFFPFKYCLFFSIVFLAFLVGVQYSQAHKRFSDNFL